MSFITRVYVIVRCPWIAHLFRTSLDIENAFHALALDEHRRPFSPTLWNLPENPKTNLVQCWFPGYHINAGGGSKDGFLDNPEGDLEQLADITFAWMVDLCSPFLEFDAKFIYLLQHNHRLRHQKHTTSNTRGWAAGKFVETYAGTEILGGSATRTPKQYNPDPLVGSNLKYSGNDSTKEYMHASVRIRLKTLGDEKWRIKSTALKDFDLVKDTNVEKDPRRSGWKWVKKLKGGGIVEIPEMRIKHEGQGDFAEMLLMDQDTLKQVKEGTKPPVKLVDVI